LNFYVPAVDTIIEADKNFHWKEKKSSPKVISEDIRRGIGMAIIWYGIGFGAGIEDTTDVIVELHQDGTATLFVGTVDYGNGSNTTFAMLTAEMLGLSLDKVKIVNGDSDRTKNCGSTVATKQTYTTGNAVVTACIPLRRDILYVASKLLSIPENEVDIGFDYACSLKDLSKKIPISFIAKQFRPFGKPYRREGLFHHQKMTTPLDPKTGTGRAWFPIAFGTQMAEVEVNVKTGKIKVNKIIAAHHVGRALNPQSVRGQIVGGISFGWGFALCEDSNYQKGIPQNLNYDKYKLMRPTDYPEVEVIVLEKDEKSGPFGAIGIGEPPTIPVAPAIANAVYDAIGIRIYDLPMTPEKVLRQLEK
jgi:CO/xanthine dehydrogenase Mo-binding subunit